MKIPGALLLLAALVLITAEVSGQDNDAAATVSNLKAQLSEVQYRQAESQIRLEQLENDLKPENLARHFNGFGSSRPEELRETRRRQLQLEKDHVVLQLEQLAADRTRLTAAISDAEARAYHQSAQGAAALSPDPNRRAWILSNAGTLVGIVVLLLVTSVALAFAIRRRQQL